MESYFSELQNNNFCVDISKYKKVNHTNDDECNTNDIINILYKNNNPNKKRKILIIIGVQHQIIYNRNADSNNVITQTIITYSCI